MAVLYTVSLLICSNLLKNYNSRFLQRVSVACHTTFQVGGKKFKMISLQTSYSCNLNLD